LAARSAHSDVISLEMHEIEYVVAGHFGAILASARAESIFP
jgi:hypothetical protein